MYETESDSFIKQLIKVIIAIILFFIIVPWLLSLGDSSPIPDEELGTFESYDGAWPRP